MIGFRSVLLQLTVSSQLFVHCSTGGPVGSHFAIAINTQPSWSPDEDRIAYCHQSNVSENGQQNSGPREIWMYSFSSDKSEYWTRGTEPAWSPDGSCIAYIGAEGHLWVASGPEPSHTLVATVSGASSPRWSPDGRQILFRRTRDGEASTFYIVNADGTGLTSTQVEGVAADFLSDGATLAYVEPNGTTFSTVRWKTLPHLPVFVASIAPDAAQFMSTRPVKGDIGFSRSHQKKDLRCWVMSSSGREQRAIAECAGTFSWSPDGEKIVLEREESGAIDLWVLTLGSNHQEKLLPDSDPES